jgi:hypothetical protein
MTEPVQPIAEFETRKLIGGLIIGLLLAETALGLIVSIVRDVIFPLMAMAMGTDPNSPLSLGPQNFNWPNLLSAIMELCLAGIVAILVNSWMQRRPRQVRGRSMSLSQAAAPIPVQAPVPVQATAPRPAPAAAPAAYAAPARPPASAPTEPPRNVAPSTAPPPARPVAPAVSAPATMAATPVVNPATAPTQPSINQAPVAGAPTLPPAAGARPTAAQPAAPQPTSQAPPKPVAAPPSSAKPKKPKQVYYNLVGEPIESDDE